MRNKPTTERYWVYSSSDHTNEGTTMPHHAVLDVLSGLFVPRRRFAFAKVTSYGHISLTVRERKGFPWATCSNALALHAQRLSELTLDIVKFIDRFYIRDDPHGNSYNSTTVTYKGHELTLAVLVDTAMDMPMFSALVEQLAQPDLSTNDLVNWIQNTIAEDVDSSTQPTPTLHKEQ